MAAALRTTTPPPPSSLHTPQTPRFGFDDNYEPYSPRKSTRVSAQRARDTRTPPPQSSRSSKKITNTSPPSSPPTASKKRTPKTSPMMGGRRVSGALSADSAASAAAALGLPTPEPQRKMDRKSATAAVRNNALLPTPNKTPKKRPSETAPGISAIARNLFPNRETVEEVMPTPKKGRKRYTGYTLDSFEGQEESRPIQIYTDSHDRVPEVDMSTDNPFYGASSVVPEPTKRASKRRKITVPGEGERNVEEVERREDGLVYVFRGKKVFRKFADTEGSQDEDNVEDDELTLTAPPNLRRPLTRSSVKPRLLFPTADQTKAKEKRSQATEDEEEAITDIEEPHAAMDLDDHVATPKPPKFAPATPPTTARATRSKKIDMDMSLLSDDEATVPSPNHIDSGKGARLSPFDNWPRTKRQTTASKKREGVTMSRASKKIRG